jgi:hypothetical protein
VSIRPTIAFSDTLLVVFTLDQVVPWGRSFDEYRRMFALTDDDLRSTILGCADGPAGFNAEASRRGVRVVSCDPIYGFEHEQIEARIAATFEPILDQTRQNLDQFVWSGDIRSVDELGVVRRAAMQTFLDDYESGRAGGRYVRAELPTLPFAAGAFDLALCSHFLFLYSSQLGDAFHAAALRELCRVAADVRVFPLLALDGGRSPFVDTGARLLREAGCAVTIETVPYEFQRGGNEMLRVRSRHAGP